MIPTEFISTGIAGVALYLSWRSQRDSKRSAQEAQRANDLLARQLELTANEQKRRIQGETAESQPLFSWQGSGGSDEGQYFDLVNLGATVSKPKVVVSDGLDAILEPKEAIVSNKKTRIRFNISKIQKLPEVVKFSVEFMDKRGESGKLDFKLESHSVGKYFNFPPQLA